MRSLIVTLALLTAAVCTTDTIFGPDGRVRFCYRCCTPDGNCTVTCLD